MANKDLSVKGASIAYTPRQRRIRVDLRQTHTVGAGEHFVLFKPYAGCHISNLVVIRKVAEGAALTCDIGDTASATGFATSVDLNVTGLANFPLTLAEGAPNTVVGYTGGKFYTADSELRLTLNQAAADKAVFDVCFTETDYSAKEDLGA